MNHIIIVKIPKGLTVEVVVVYEFKRKFIRYWLCLWINKIRKREVETINYEKRFTKNNWYIRYR